MSLWIAVPLAVAALGLIGLMRRFLSRDSRPIVDDRGILAPGSGWGRIPWDEVEGAYPPTVEDTQTLHLRVRVTERLARALRRRRDDRPLGEAVELRLDLSETDLTAVEVLREILVRAGSARSARES